MNNDKLYNGEIVAGLPQKLFVNRAFKYGDGVFETIKVSQGYPLFYRSHYSRLIRGLDALEIDIPEHFHFQYFFHCLQKLIEATDVANGVLRVQAWRSGKGTYRPEKRDFDWLAEMKETATDEAYFQWTNTEYRMDVFEGLTKQFSSVSSYKTCNSLPYVLAGEFARNSDLANAFILNDEGNVVESIAENVFIFQQGKVITPPISDGPVDGIMRSMLRKIFLWNKIEFEERSLSIRDIEQAQEVFLSNSIKGIVPVTHFRNSSYFQAFSEGLFHKLNERVGQILDRNAQMR